MMKAIIHKEEEMLLIHEMGDVRDDKKSHKVKVRSFLSRRRSHTLPKGNDATLVAN